MSGNSKSTRSGSSSKKRTCSDKSSSSGSARRTGSASGKTTASANRGKSARKSSVSTVSSSGRKKLTVAQRRELQRQQQITQVLVTVACIMVVLILVLVFMLLYDKQSRDSRKQDFTNSTSSAAEEELPDYVYPASKDFTPLADGEQLKLPREGEEVAVLETSLGKIKIRLFPQAAPTAVESFKTLIADGRYDGVRFHRVINNFMIQGGIIDGVNCAFEGYQSFQDEFDRNLYSIRGALSMANGGANTNGTQFFIVQTTEPQYGGVGDAETFVANGGAQWAADAYEERGGTPYLDGQFRAKGLTRRGHTVFGQVYEGMSVVDRIAAVETDANDAPLEDVIIKKAYLETVKDSKK